MHGLFFSFSPFIIKSIHPGGSALFCFSYYYYRSAIKRLILIVAYRIALLLKGRGYRSNALLSG